ncbi:CRISPR-associated protein Cas3 (plasmid) [Deferribacter desulfuricans SSM1]|uniref:CRISPR-associated protein Cas3 n=1 Tax=Deferribacter desulfuricans (strain DSM 14783 / JCM 11476 / NBRC 101012 / SSM1) TaxID=639282 RepID=D3PEQ0_DEFDS|nr:CRISPR-associated helicase/endonuclease Cas3 [Deferribacter desulfuricans]BAI81692.1 CRISPR-associated protein Cas3 [Deferribacter desulfuricans SSM1]
MATKSGLLSHPDKQLEDHISNVIKLVNNFYDNTKLNDNILKNILTIISFAHDVGKATTAFQEYIKGNSELKNKPETTHSLFGACISLYLTDRYLKSINQNNDFLLFLSFVIPRLHHSNLVDVYQITLLDENQIELLTTQLNLLKINQDQFYQFIENTKINNKDLIKFNLNEINFNNIILLIRQINKFIKNIRTTVNGLNKTNILLKSRINSKPINIDYYIIVSLLYSILIDADKSDAGIKADKNILFKRDNLSSEIIDNFINTLKFKKTDIVKLRQQAFQEITTKDIDINNKIYTLTLPTGLGKTLLSFKLALKLSNKIKEEKNVIPKIIYCLPFLSVIEQNYNVIKSVLETNNIKVDNSILIKHHYLTDMTYTYQNDEFEYDTSKLLIEGWNGQIITTTFLQFFYSLIGNKNKMLRKFHKLTNSIVILDEIQSIPQKYWLLLKEVLNKMAEKFNFYVILTTATQPMIFDKKQYIELASNNYFDKLDRYVVNINKDLKTVDEFYYSLNIEKNKTYLFIMNTVNSAKRLYELLKKEYKNDILFLSTHITPKERLKRIQQIKNNDKRIVVSTQLVEAGVDIDFDVVYRDFAPLDSLIQSAGRCNRNGEKTTGIFNILKLYNENHQGRLYGSYIYDTLLLTATEQILDKEFFTEPEFIQLTNKYFQKVNEIKSNSDSLELLKILSELKFTYEKDNNKITSVEDFKLINNNYPRIDVFIQLDDTAVTIWKEYIKISNIKDYLERKRLFNNIKKDFFEYIISVPIKDNMNIPPIENNFYYVPIDNLDDYYDYETGFKTDSNLYIAL